MCLFPGTPDHADHKDEGSYKFIFGCLMPYNDKVADFWTSIFRIGYVSFGRSTMSAAEAAFLANFAKLDSKLIQNELTPLGDEPGFKILHILPEELVDTENRPTLIYMHGGGMTAGSTRQLSLQIANTLRVQIFSIDYRLSPENPFPAPVDDCVNATRWVLNQHVNNPEKFKIGKFGIFGDSSGGCLAIATCFAVDYEKEFGVKPEVILPIVPMLQCARFDTPSYTNKYMTWGPLTRNQMIRSWLTYAGENIYNRKYIKFLSNSVHQDLPKDILNRVDPENLLTDEDFKLHFTAKKVNSNEVETKKSSNKVDTENKKVDNFTAFQNRMHNLMKNELFCPGLASDEVLKKFLKNTKSVRIMTAGLDVLHSDGKMLYNRLDKLKDEGDVLSLIDYHGAHHSLYGACEIYNGPVFGAKCYNRHFNDICDSLSVIKK